LTSYWLTSPNLSLRLSGGLREQGLDVVLKILRCDLALIVFERYAVAIAQKLVEVPADLADAELRLDEAVQRERLTPVYVNLGEVGIRCVVFEGARIHVAHLEQELIAREGQDLEALRMIRRVKGIHALVARISQASQARDVRDQADFALVLVQRDALVLHVLHVELKDVRRCIYDILVGVINELDPAGQGAKKIHSG